MVAAFGRPETVFTVLAESARRRRTTTLVVQLAASAMIAGGILVSAPHWWSLAFLAGWSAAYSAWGLVVRVAEVDETHRRSFSALLTTITALGTALAVAGIIGVGLAIYSGDAMGAKNGRCVKNATSKRCEASQHPVQGVRLP
jgi:ABC-type phosphate transport system permease subunit